MADKLRESLAKRYPPGAAETVFASMLGGARGPFGPGNARYQEHVDWAMRAGVPPIVGKKKPPTSRPGASGEG